MKLAKRLEGCIIGGAIGDAMGSSFENQIEQDSETYHFGAPPKQTERDWGITDDTQLTIGTLRAMTKDKELNPEIFANEYLNLYNKRILRGLGGTTLKALRELKHGGHWSQVGRRGEYAAGNGAAMRIAPLAFSRNLSKSKVRDI
ncbi:MAG: ADP-ribosylglycohydrolase family protein, partial [Bacteroidota bacterium]